LSCLSFSTVFSSSECKDATMQNVSFVCRSRGWLLWWRGSWYDSNRVCRLLLLPVARFRSNIYFLSFCIFVCTFCTILSISIGLASFFPLRLYLVFLLTLFLFPFLLHFSNLFGTDRGFRFLGFWFWFWRACRKPMISEMDWACVKEIRSVDRREDGHGGFVAYEASFGGGRGSLVVEIRKDHRIQVRRA